MDGEDMAHMHSVEYYSAIKKEWNNAICSNRDGPRGSHTEGSKSEREGEIPYDNPLHVESKKKSYLQDRKKLTGLENKLIVAQGKDGRKG